MLWALIALGFAEAPSEQTIVYYNARLALREGRPLEATKLWFLRNTIEDRTGEVSPHDGDFHTATWAALGEMGICQDGLPADRGGAGLWPIAMHNWVVRNRGRRTRSKRPRPFDAFELGRQQRFVSIGEVLGLDELRTVALYRGGCAGQRVALLNAGESVTAKLSDRQVAARLMRYLLEKSRETWVEGRVRGTAAVEARLFDIDLQLTALAAREARQKERELGRKGREQGLSRQSVIALREDAPDYSFSEDSEAARILRACVSWPVEEWMALSPDRRLFLFDHAVRRAGSLEALDETQLSIIDALIEAQQGGEVTRWIARREDISDPAIWSGSRGAALLALDRDSGFTERAVIALHRGVDHLQRGELPESLRSFAYALQAAPDSRVDAEVRALSLRWLSFVASRFEITDTLLATFQELVPRREYSVLLEDLIWRAAFHADLPSFERGARNQLGRGALGRRIELLTPLAQGQTGVFVRTLRDRMVPSPGETLRFIDQLIQRLETEDREVRQAQLPMLIAIHDRVLRPLTGEEGGRQGRKASTLMARTMAIIEGLGGADPHRATRSIDPGGEVFAGSVRLAPADPLPWPFRPSQVPAPSIFTPLDLTPVEWSDGEGGWVFGWSLGG